MRKRRIEITMEREEVVYRRMRRRGRPAEPAPLESPHYRWIPTWIRRWLPAPSSCGPKSPDSDIR